MTETDQKGPSGPATVPPKKLTPFFDGVSAALGSTVSIAVLQPFDMLKVRLQGSGYAATGTVAAPRPGLIGTFFTVLRNEGPSQFWRGIGPTVIANSVAWGVYMHFYETFKNMLKKQTGTETLPIYMGFGAGVAAGMSQVFITNPIFLIKTRMQLQTPGSPSYYTGFIDGLRKTVTGEGFFGLYKGVVPGLWLTFHGGIQMSTYDEIKQFFCRRAGGKPLGELTKTEIFAAGCLSKFLASTSLYPFQVIKTRLQDERNIPGKDKVVYTGTLDVARKIYRSEGIYGFYRGVLPNTMKVIPNSSITLLAFEEIKKLMINSGIGCQ
ncbi:hypothetical protein SAMD00019534_054920 [Acytostelium subglobosum LB1]|uniref:hypothetical protein n=1 Tax=Acytostelium subglobosum LB1 TaxID=1410327 RepID=UPI000644E21D|nr:hypothetical protein SAMD00019534_054920 [Acytostelium subglobosum LB1]GAM22317.1 hypothetical protein SAMD00019534_054920 [Acytostelium subglobosum LB1]|eukprot:XP_012754437.1 hypothetical protein SAMD00019534_054920 [Acytostelium subglobosum LB1]